MSRRARPDREPAPVLTESPLHEALAVDPIPIVPAGVNRPAVAPPPSPRPEAEHARASYLAVLRTPHVVPAFTATVLGRLGYGGITLALLLELQSRRGSFALAGTALALFGVATIVMPLKARQIDRFGQRRILPVLGVGFGCALSIVPFVPSVAAVVLVAVGGTLAPPIGPSMRARWSAQTVGAQRSRAFALDTVSEESLYVVAPAIAGVVSAFSPGAGVIAAGLLVATGGIGLGLAPGAPSASNPSATGTTTGTADGTRTEIRTGATGAGTTAAGTTGTGTTAAGTTATRRAGANRISTWRPPPGIAASLVVALLFGVGIAAIELAVTARAVDAGQSHWVGLLLGGLALGSAVGGAVWGRRLHHQPAGRQLAVLGGWLALGAVAVGAVTPIVAQGLVLLVAGLAVSPLIIVLYLAVDNRTEPGRRTEANTWVGTAMNLGGAGGAAVAGALAAHPGAATTIMLAAIPLLLTTVAARSIGSAARPSARE